MSKNEGGGRAPRAPALDPPLDITKGNTTTQTSKAAHNKSTLKSYER